MIGVGTTGFPRDAMDRIAIRKLERLIAGRGVITLLTGDHGLVRMAFARSWGCASEHLYGARPSF